MAGSFTHLLVLLSIFLCVVRVGDEREEATQELLHQHEEQQRQQMAWLLAEMEQRSQVLNEREQSIQLTFEMKQKSQMLEDMKRKSQMLVDMEQRSQILKEREERILLLFEIKQRSQMLEEMEQWRRMLKKKEKRIQLMFKMKQRSHIMEERKERIPLMFEMKQRRQMLEEMEQRRQEPPTVSQESVLPSACQHCCFWLPAEILLLLLAFFWLSRRSSSAYNRSHSSKPVAELRSRSRRRWQTTPGSTDCRAQLCPIRASLQHLAWTDMQSLGKGGTRRVVPASDKAFPQRNFGRRCLLGIFEYSFLAHRF